MSFSEAIFDPDAVNDNDLAQKLHRLAYAVSHDMGTPLRHVKGFTELLERNIEGSLDERTDSYLKHLKSATARLDDMMDGVLNYSRITTRGKPPKKIKAAEIVAEVVEEIIESRIKVPLISHYNLPEIYADPIQFKRLWQELIDNAMTYSQPERVADVSITCNRAGDKWLFTVSDKGTGMPASICERVFTMFYRGVLEKDYPDGQGIGLALCEQIIQRHGGTIWCESEEGQGSRFHFTWPIQEWRENFKNLH